MAARGHGAGRLTGGREGEQREDRWESPDP